MPHIKQHVMICHYFLCVHTNIGYCVIAEFIVQSEATEYIQEALEVLRRWNLDWNPQFFMTDFSEQKYQLWNYVL